MIICVVKALDFPIMDESVQNDGGAYVEVKFIDHVAVWTFTTCDRGSRALFLATQHE